MQPETAYIFMKNSICKKISRLLAVSLIVLSFFMILFNLIVIYRSSDKNVQILMKETCNSQAAELDNRFRLVEQSVKNLYEISEKFRPDAADLKNEKTAEQYVAQFMDVALTVAENTDNALAIYYRMNPELSNSGKTGFFWVKSSEAGKFEEFEATDILAYDKDDVEHVGWYYIPVNEGKPLWMEPYYNANINVEMISYVVPIFDGDTLVGVVGIDIDFNEIKETAGDIDIYESSGGVLCSSKDGMVYSNQKNPFGSTLPDDIHKIIKEKNSCKNVMSWENGSKSYDYYFCTLNNHMKFLIYAEKDEIFSQGELFIHISLGIFFIVFVITLIASINIGRKIVKPISDIIEATKKYSQGNWNVRVRCTSNDELQLLTENISIMADKTKHYIRCIQDLAKKDGLTGLRNKNDYIVYIGRLNEEFIDENKKFAVVVFDVNNLKIVNDHYGHDKGDELLVSASRFICRYFSHSPVFRIGGDEFVAVVNGADYENRNAILEEFQSHMRLASEGRDMMTVCVSSGMAEFDKDGSTFDEVFEAADHRMYENKTQLKGNSPR